MRAIRWLGLAPIGLVGGALWTAGCSDWLDLTGNCVVQRMCCADGTLHCLLGPGGGDGGTGGHEAGADGSGGGDGDSATPGCDPSSQSDPVADTCGVFVSSSTGNDATGKGTMAAPYRTLAKALSISGGTPVYACGEAFPEAVTISKATKLYGALVCKQHGWTYDSSKKTAIMAPADTIALTVASGAGGTEVHDFAVTAADATKAGGSSIAVLALAGMTLENVDVTAGAAMDGAAGMTSSQVTTPVSAQGGNGTNIGCSTTATNGGGTPGQNTCLSMGVTVDVSGGIGGTGAPTASGIAGFDGNPAGTMGKGGRPQGTSGSCSTGGDGANGTPGGSGDGAHGIGDVDASGYHAPLAKGGTTTGGPGQGGGGGGGAAMCTGGGSGPGGGGGGAGGCGGMPGGPGQSGGSSIGILTLGGSLTLRGSVTIATSDGGAGGAGGNGQKGANGGLGGQPGGSVACGGGKGGQGGRGGSGGGGAGGHSVAIAFKGTAPDLGSATIRHGGAGAGGTGGDGDTSAQGGDGLACSTLDFATPASPACVM